MLASMKPLGLTLVLTLVLRVAVTHAEPPVAPPRPSSTTMERRPDATTVEPPVAPPRPSSTTVERRPDATTVERSAPEETESEARGMPPSLAPRGELTRVATFPEAELMVSVDLRSNDDAAYFEVTSER